jgi:hypothetical protein
LNFPRLAKIFPKLNGIGGDASDEPKRRQKRVEFVKAIGDVLKLRKNVAVCRNFQELDRSDGRFMYNGG